MRKFIFRVLHRLAQKTDNVIDDLLLEGLEGPSALLIIALALYISIRLSELPETYMVYAVKGMYLSLILTVTMGLANTSGRLLAYFLKKVDLPISVSSLLNAVAKAIVYAIGVLIMLNFVGISITPIITALGVGGLAMALALQDTLSNLFAGIHILAEHTIRVGDYIRLENGQEGTLSISAGAPRGSGSCRTTWSLFRTASSLKAWSRTITCLNGAWRSQCP